MRRSRAKRRKQLLDHTRGQVRISKQDSAFVHRNAEQQIKELPGWTEDTAKRFRMEPDTKAYRWGDLSIFVSRSTHGWHVSVAHPNRYPTWDEMADIRYALVPDSVTMALVLPPTAQYINAHPNVFQMWEIHDGQKRMLGWVSAQLSRMRR